MELNSRQVLEFDRVLDALAAHAVGAEAKRRLLSLTPTANEKELHARFAPVRDLLDLFARNGSLPMRGYGDLKPVLAKADLNGGVLLREEWLELERFFELCGELVRFRTLPTHRSLGSLLTVLAPIVYPEALHHRLRDIFDDHGGIRDNATPGLARIRAERRALDQRLLRESQRLAADLHQRGLLQENFTTVRNGRIVLPVKATHRQRLTGIVHGSSGTGETVFMEPAELVQLSNQIELVHEAEQEEIFQLFVALTEDLRAILPSVEENYRTVVQADFLLAIAKVSWCLGWNCPTFEAGGALRLFKAHHPLLQLYASNSVPVNIVLDRVDRCIVLSGPNAGGKTTSMKLIGLVSMMAQSGIPIPVSPESTLPIYDTVLADIGDSQSLTDGLSTFSGHIRRIAAIYSAAGPRSLVLLDELGTGTDPVEGTALALALLKGFQRKAGLTITTSHLSPVKQWAEDTPGARNASFSLDPTTHRPTYRLRLDLPGASEALEIARNEGLASEILTEARQLVGEKHLRMGELLQRIEDRERRLAIAVKEAEARASSLAQQEELARQRAELLKIERRETREKTLRDQEAAIAQMRERIERLIADLPSENEVARRREGLLRAREEVLRGQDLTNAEKRKLAEASVDKGLLLPGQRVFLPRMRQWGSILSVEAGGKKVRLRLGELEIIARADELREHDPAERRALAEEKEESIEGKTGQAKKKKSRRIRNALRSAEEYSGPALKPTVTLSGRAVHSVSRPSSMMLDLHGFRVEEALQALEKFIDQSLLSGFPYIKVCHGTGTGRLYRAVHEYLRSHPSVRAYRFATPDEGGGGMTIVDL